MPFIYLTFAPNIGYLYAYYARAGIAARISRFTHVEAGVHSYSTLASELVLWVDNMGYPPSYDGLDYHVRQAKTLFYILHYQSTYIQKKIEGGNMKANLYVVADALVIQLFSSLSPLLSPPSTTMAGNYPLVRMDFSTSQTAITVQALTMASARPHRTILPMGVVLFGSTRMERFLRVTLLAPGEYAVVCMCVIQHMDGNYKEYDRLWSCQSS